jgi:hypothetical protein
MNFIVVVALLHLYHEVKIAMMVRTNAVMPSELL